MHGNLNDRQSLLDELRNVSKPLIDSCDERIAGQIKAAVENAVENWNDKCDELMVLCTKYQKAINLWKNYREASDAIKIWAEQQMTSLNDLQPIEASKQAKVL